MVVVGVGGGESRTTKALQPRSVACSFVQNQTAEAGTIRPMVGGSGRKSSRSPPLRSVSRSAVSAEVCRICACTFTASAGVSMKLLKAPATLPANICAACESSHLSAVPML